MLKKQYFLFATCVVFFLIKLIAISTTDFNLYGDEAQYWLWSKNLSFGYYSKPPLLSWLVWFVGLLLGDTFFTIKLIPVILYCVTSYLVFIFSKKLWGDSSLAFYCAITFFLLPSVSLSSFLLSTDVILVLFWMVALIQLLNIQKNPSLFNFVFFGFILGLALMAKYAALYFFISLIIFMVVEKNFRKVFFESKYNLFFFCLTLTIIVLPNMIWNYQNGWITFEHTAANASLDNIKLNYLGFIEFIFSQIIMIGPILFFGMLYCLKQKNKLSTNYKLLLSFSLPALIIVSIESLLVRAHANWAAVALLSLTVLFVSLVYRANKNILSINNYINLLVGITLFVMIGASVSLPIFDRINGIKNFVVFLDKNNKENYNNIVVSDRLLFANLNYEYFLTEKVFYMPHRPGTSISNHFQLKNSLPKNFTQNFILIGNKNEINYLDKEMEVVDIGSGFFPFSKEKLKIYEIKFN